MAISTLTSTATAPSSTAIGALTATTAASTGSTTPGTAPPASATAPSPSTSVTLSALSAEAGIVATLNGGSTSQTYDATGLLNLVAQAGMAQAGAAGKAAAAANGDTPESTSTPGTVSADWGTILKSNPGLTSTAVGYAVTQDIVNTLSTYA